MTKLMKRLLCVAAMVLVIISLSLLGFAEDSPQLQDPVCYTHGDVNTDGSVDTRDAVYILYHIMFEQIPGYADRYPIDQDWDYAADETNDIEDAKYLLYHIMFEGVPEKEDEYLLRGEIHDYYDPSWVWKTEGGTVTATVTLKCGCGEAEPYTAAVTTGERKEATCVETGYQNYSASVTVDGEEYTGTYVEILPVSGDGHIMQGTQGCESNSVCSKCGYTLAALGHNWKEETSVKATCTDDAYVVYKCSADGCGATETVTQEGTASHSMEYLEERQEGCKVTKWYKCANCDHTAAGTNESEDVYYKHTYTAALTTEATCSAAGVKTYTCSVCSHSYTEAVPTNDSHDWVKGGTDEAGVTTYTCSRDSSHTKTVVEAKADTALDTEALQNELQLGENASMKLDNDTVEGLKQDVMVNVEAKTPDELEISLSDEQKAQIGGNKIYDFSMVYADGSEISEDGTKFEGTVTISLPYALEEGEDVDSINVWYIDDSNNLTAVKATYSNGFVTFTTDHFSYYTVTRLTPAQRCEAYGHVMVTRSKDATCTEDGFEMELCQRCGVTVNTVVKAHTGHDFKRTVTTEATCAAKGAFEEICGNCGAITVGEIPALGHTMQLDDDQTVVASCKQAGKTVSVCTRSGCGHKVEVIESQKNHNFAPDQDVKATCSAKGYRTNKCTLCGETVVVEERAPLGHQFSVGKWNWSADHLSATVTLVCSNDNSHTKELTAVVTEQIQASSCVAGGSATYTATASFNNVTFFDTKTETTAAAGHTTGTKWESDDAQHYHTCGKCGVKVDATSHTWDEGVVTLAPTCDADGKETVTCLICDYTLEKTVPKTGEHTYVNGVCSGCGLEENSCFHLKTTETPVDLSGYDLCEGAELIKISCACGENTQYDYRLNCKIDYNVAPETVVIDGVEREKYTYTCSVCGLVIEEISMQRPVDGECAMEQGYIESLYKDGREIATAEHVYGVRPHPGVTLVETVDLTAEEYGLCGEKIAFYVCGCDAKVRSSRLLESCDWIFDSYNAQTGEQTYHCEGCGAVRVTKSSEEQEKGSCNVTYTTTYTYYMGDKVVYTFSISTPGYQHTWETDSCELFGDSCEDGVYVISKCKLCGELAEDYLQWHEDVKTTSVDLSGYEFCASSVRITSCACKLAQTFELVYPEGVSECQWQEVPAQQQGTSAMRCQVCGVTMTRAFAESKDENCVYVGANAYTFTDAAGTKILSVNENYVETSHAYQVISKELMGESCFDGIKITRACKDCGYYSSGWDYNHTTYLDATYDLSELGICQEGLAVEKCLCGRNVMYKWISDNGECNWNEIHFEGNGERWLSVYQCGTCGAVMEEQYELVSTDDPCVKLQRTTLTFYKSLEEQEPLKEISFSEIRSSHDMLATFQLNNSALGCAGGYTVTHQCRNCDYSENSYYSGVSNHSNTFVVAKEKVSTEPLCEEVYLCTSQCPCGARKHADIEVAGSAKCVWEWTGPNTATCSVCHVTRTETHTREKVAGTTCQYKDTVIYSYTLDGEVLFSVTTEQTGYNHRCVYTFVMEGQTCQDGYQVLGNCLDCGEQMQGWDSGCMAYEVERITAVKDEDACGIVELVHRKCPCGAQDSWNVNSSCIWDQTGYDENGNWEYTCQLCGMIRTEDRTTERIPGTCRYQVSVNDTYQLGEKTYKLEEDYTYTGHTMVAVFDCPTGSCLDGYSVSWKCQHCDYTEPSGGPVTPMHTTYRTAFYDLKDYGMCGGSVWQNRCACGEESNWQWNLGYCNGRPTGNIDPDTGKYEYYCDVCQSYFSYGETGERDPETCTFSGTFCFKLRTAEGEELLDLQGATKRVSHAEQIKETVLQNPAGDCEDGIRYIWQCPDCAITWEGYGYGHATYPVMTIETACGQVTYSRCACNKQNRVDNSCSSMSGRTWEETDDNGVVHTYNEDTCAVCGLYILKDSYGQKTGVCQVNQTYTYTIRYGEREETVTFVRQEEVHNYGPETGALQPGATTCADGIVVTQTCKDCSDVRTLNYNYHKAFVQEEIDLAEMGSCGGTLRILRCPCGLVVTDSIINEMCGVRHNFWSETGADGVEYHYEEKTCEYCGMVTTTVSHYEETADPCRRNHFRKLTVRCGENERTFELRNLEDFHDYKYSYVLADGAQSCEDGVYASWSCTRCTASNSWTTRSHQTYVAETIDLKDFGSICGGTLDHNTCACGKYSSWHLNNDVQCDLDEENIPCWIENVINEYQPNIHYTGTFSNAYLYRCAVTDPESCPLTIRRMTYWLKEDNCTAVQYERWQLGYDEETGTCQRELFYATGNVMTFHNYEETDLYQVAEDGSSVAGTRYSCTDCQSTYTNQRDYSKDDQLLREEYTYVNTLNDSDVQYYQKVLTYELMSEGDNIYSKLVQERYDITEADGTARWEECRYTYNKEACTREGAYTYSDRASFTRTEIHHFSDTRHEETKVKTCSQPGYYHYWYSCDRCGKISSQYKQDYLPGHSWEWNVDEQQYVCYICGLRNENGADGAIIMEDLTDTYGNGTEYVIGYYNPLNIQFVANVSVILDQVTDGDNQIDLNITEFTDKTTEADGYTGLSFDKAAADAAAKQAVEGYEGTYAIRISFVPVGSSDTLDYAITFDSVTAE